jgi:predicted CopG family antitoxin
MIMHGRLMAIKTISLELDAYESLKAVKRHPRESFSEVVRRLVQPKKPITGKQLFDKLQEGRFTLTEEDAETIDRLNRDDVPPLIP